MKAKASIVVFRRIPAGERRFEGLVDFGHSVASIKGRSRGIDRHLSTQNNFEEIKLPSKRSLSSLTSAPPRKPSLPPVRPLRPPALPRRAWPANILPASIWRVSTWPARMPPANTSRARALPAATCARCTNRNGEGKGVAEATTLFTLPDLAPHEACYSTPRQSGQSLALSINACSSNLAWLPGTVAVFDQQV